MVEIRYTKKNTPILHSDVPIFGTSECAEKAYQQQLAALKAESANQQQAVNNMNQQNINSGGFNQYYINPIDMNQAAQQQQMMNQGYYNPYYPQQQQQGLGYPYMNNYGYTQQQQPQMQNQYGYYNPYYPQQQVGGMNQGYYNPYMNQQQGYPYQQQQMGNGYNPYMNQQQPYQQQSANPAIDYIQQQQMNNPYGYNPYQQQQQGYYNPYMNQQQGYPYQQQQMGNGYNPYMNQQQPYMQQSANPAIDYIRQQQMYGNQYYNGYNQNMGIQFQQPQQQQQPEYIHIPGISRGGEFMPTIGYEDRIEQLKYEFFKKETEEQYNRAKNSNGYNNIYGYNYYGANPYGYNNSSVYAEASKKIEEIKDEFRRNRKEFELKLAKLAHNIAGDGIDEETLEEMYNGKVIKNPNYYCDPVYNQGAAARNLVPFDNSQMYRNFHAAVSAEFHKIIPENANLKEFLELSGILGAKYAMEEEMHRRQNFNNKTMGAFNDAMQDAYFECLREKIVNELASEDEAPEAAKEFDRKLKNRAVFQKALFNALPALRHSKINDEGDLTISIDFDTLKEDLAEYERIENMTPEDIKDVDDMLAFAISALE